ncbi:hypothetical protein EV421DRAFT_1440383 [Armillaria borealis]|uniref:Secreted protein n=1 Tax=Armillaria borealis TaxID=47425 RepID=A0AA39MGA6_9AGAR|nr:hypothetical protein EV421DRAFT_1440383 [Armillaria borealis]
MWRDWELPLFLCLPGLVSFHPNQAWYNVFSNLDSRTPLWVAHGSPVLSHDYLSDLSTEFCTPVINYDQIRNCCLIHLP